MIQRKQSLFLLATAIIAILMLFIPFQTIDITASAAGLSLLEGLKHPDAVSSQIYIPLILDILIILLSFITIFQFKNRILQYKLANLTLLFNVFVTGLFFLLSFFKGNAKDVHFTFGAFLPLVGGAFAFLAGHFIKKDEQLVRSADRIR